jgi:Flp pilus assembly protein TadD
VRAKVLARRGDHTQAERFAREAVSIGQATDFLNIRGDAHADLAAVLLVGGNVNDAAATLEQALALYQQKENLVSAQWVGTRLSELGRPTAPPNSSD